jgi:hypothetical protein
MTADRTTATIGKRDLTSKLGNAHRTARDTGQEALAQEPARAKVPQDIVARLRQVCLRLPEAYEEVAWVGTRWMVRKKNFAHVLMIDRGWPPAYAKAVKSSGPICVLTFRSLVAELHAPSFTHLPFFRPGWWPNIAGVVLDAQTDWVEVSALITKSYCELASKKLVALVQNPPA